ncbi:MAG: 16S rRNA (uracil(1498)-N(3))-methyltransferase [Victivallales bacterium]|jgi:RsmE family RNA methyltransferase
MNLVIIYEEELAEDGIAVICDPRRALHIQSILRVLPGDKIKVGLLNGRIGTGKILSSTPGKVELQAEFSSEPPPVLPVTLIFALPRPKTYKKILQAATAVGVKKFILIDSWKVDKSYWDSPVLFEEEIREQFILGLEQGGDTALPEISVKRRFKPFVEDELTGIIKGKLPLLAHPGAVCDCPRNIVGPVVLCVGPEGGFTEYEVALLEKYGMQPVSIGARILRTEFAVCMILGRLF